MEARHRWALSVATSTGVLGLAITSGVVLLAHRLVDEFSRPHLVVDEKGFTWKMPVKVPEPPRSCQHPLTFQTTDGTLLCGDFWTQPQPAPTVVFSHGYRTPRKHLRPAAALEYATGYNVLLFDYRGHGESESVITSAGMAEVRDLEAAITVASLQPETLPGKIILHGFSMGASIALLVLPHPDVAAVIADSPYARMDQIIQRIIETRLTMESASWPASFHYLRHLFPAVASATTTACAIDFRLRFGHELIARPDTSFKRRKTAPKGVPGSHPYPPILLIHAQGDDFIPIAQAHQLVEAAQENGILLETYFVNDPIHCGAYGYDPDQYVATIQQFLARHVPDVLAYKRDTGAH